MHSSRMRAACLLPESGPVGGGGVSGPGGVLVLGGGGVCDRGYIPACTRADPHPPQEQNDRQVQILPCPKLRMRAVIILHVYTKRRVRATLTASLPGRIVVDFRLTRLFSRYSGAVCCFLVGVGSREVPSRSVTSK